MFNIFWYFSLSLRDGTWIEQRICFFLIVKCDVYCMRIGIEVIFYLSSKCQGVLLLPFRPHATSGVRSIYHLPRVILSIFVFIDKKELPTYGRFLNVLFPKTKRFNTPQSVELSGGNNGANVLKKTCQRPSVNPSSLFDKVIQSTGVSDCPPDFAFCFRP